MREMGTDTNGRGFGTDGDGNNAGTYEEVPSR